MARRFGGLRLALPAALILVATLAACTPTIPSPTPAPATPSPTASPRLPTPVPTVFSSPEPTQPVEPDPAELVVRLTSCGHTCGPEPGTTVLADGRVIWSDPLGRPIAATLTPEALQRIRDELDASGVLETSADYQAKLRPGATPVGHGATLHRFERVLDRRLVVVTSGDPGDYADQPRAWIVPPEMTTVARLVEKLRDPLAWLGQDAFSEPASPYEPERYLVVVDLYPDVGAGSGEDPDVDEVRWPFGEPIEAVGEAAHTDGGGLGTRCLVVDAAVARATVAAERDAGGKRDLKGWLSAVEYDWRRGDGFVDISMTPLLPHETGSCVDLMPTFQ